MAAHSANEIVRSLILGCAVVPTALGQLPPIAPSPPDRSRTGPPASQPFVRTFLQDEWQLWPSPFRRGGYTSHTLKKYVIPFVVIGTVFVATDHKTAFLLPNTRDQAVWSNRVSTIGSLYSLLGISCGTYLMGKAIGDRHAK